MSQHYRKELILILSLSLLATGALATDAPTITVLPADNTLDLGETSTVTVLLDTAPTGLSGFNITIALTNSSVGEFTQIAFPPWAMMPRNGSLPADSVYAQAVDLEQQVGINATNVTLCTLTFRGDAVGTTNLTITPIKVDDDIGGRYAPTVVPASVTVGTTPTPTPAVELSLIPRTATIFPGDVTRYTMVMDSAPTGLSGFNISVALTNPSVGEIVDLSYPAWAMMPRNGSLPADSVFVQAVDLEQQVGINATNVTLCTLTFRGDAVGTTNLTITPIKVDDDIGGRYAPGTTDAILVVETLPAPVANFTANTTTGPAPLAVQFNDTSIGEVSVWFWSFGDGATSNDQSPTHTYTVPGNYTVALTVSDGNTNDTMTKEHYIRVQPALPRAELIFNVNYNRGTANDTIASGTSPCTLTYYTGVYNLPENRESIPGDLFFALDAPEIISTEPAAEINGTRVTWAFPPSTAIKPGATLSTSAMTSTTANRSSGVMLERSCNRTIFTEAGVQQVTLNITFDTVDLDDLWGRVVCTNTTDVSSAFVPGTFSTDLPHHSLSEERAVIQVMVNRSRVEVGREYTLSCAVEVNPLRPVDYAPACAVWEVLNSTSTGAPAGTAVTLPAGLLPQNVTSLEFASNTFCKWTCVHNDHLITSLHQRAVPVPAPVANFTANTTTGPAPLVVEFTDTSTGDPTAWNWFFGDGATSNEQNSTHTYTTPGNYTVNLTVSSGASSDTLSRLGYITVTVRGDFNGNGEVDIGDVSKVAYMVVGKEPADLVADFNGNGRVDIGDAAKIAYFLVEKIDML